LEGDELVLNYSKFYHLIRHFNPEFKKTLIIGGAAYSFPKEYLKVYPSKQIDVVEIDPMMTEAAKKHFDLKENANLQIFHTDGRVFLNQTENKYDVILIDAFTSIYSVPFQLTTIEAIRQMERTLNKNGVIFVNLISAFEGDGSKFLNAEVKTFREVFPNVYIFKANAKKAETVPQNAVLVITKADNLTFESDDAEIAALLKQRYEKELNSTLPTLSDDFAPVEYYNLFAQNSK
jgi:spermidine synthase